MASALSSRTFVDEPPAAAAFARHLTQTAWEPFDPPIGT